MHVFQVKYGKLSLNYSFYPFLSGALSFLFFFNFKYIYIFSFSTRIFFMRVAKAFQVSLLLLHKISIVLTEVFNLLIKGSIVFFLF